MLGYSGFEVVCVFDYLVCYEVVVGVVGNFYFFRVDEVKFFYCFINDFYYVLVIVFVVVFFYVGEFFVVVVVFFWVGEYYCEVFSG